MAAGTPILTKVAYKHIQVSSWAAGAGTPILTKVAYKHIQVSSWAAGAGGVWRRARGGREGGKLYGMQMAWEKQGEGAGKSGR